jgi:pimeloyl-ACP methyl ester carboxylesterase
VQRSPYPESALTDYYYQLSAAPASGEMAFRKILGVTEWALPLLAEVEALPMPVTLIWGEGDELVEPANGVRANELIPTSELIIIPGAAHAPYSETPQQFHEAILNSQFRITR